MSMSQFLLRPATFTPEEAAAAFARAKKSRNGNPVSVAKTFYYESYRRVLERARVLAVVQNNNLTAQEYQLVKQRLRAQGFAVSHVRNGLLWAAAKDHFGVLGRRALLNQKKLQQGQEEASSQQPSEEIAGNHSLDAAKAAALVRRFHRMLVGPSFMVFSDATAEDRPNLLRDITNALTPESLSAAVCKKLLVAGALVEGRHALSRVELEQSSKLPSLAQQRSELVGILSSAGGARLVGTLGQHSQMLVRTLSARQ